MNYPQPYRMRKSKKLYKRTELLKATKLNELVHSQHVSEQRAYNAHNAHVPYF